MLHWIEDTDAHGFAVWHRFVECSHWGLFYTSTSPKWELTPITDYFKLRTAAIS